MTVFQALILGLVQGLAEFLPISSTAHLVLVPWLLRWSDPGLTFDVAIHFGTLIAVVLFFWRDLLNILIGGAKSLKGIKSREGNLFWLLVAAVIPGAIFGVLLEKKADTVLRSPMLIASMLIIMGIILYLADRKSSKSVEIDKAGLGTGLLIGLAQAVAIIPGVSRSGVTMTAGLFAGFTRESAARFSFLLSAPIIFGAVLIKIPEMLANPSMINLAFCIGVATSFLTGILSIGFLLRYLQKSSFQPFVWYRLILGIIVMVIAFTRI